MSRKKVKNDEPSLWVLSVRAVLLAVISNSGPLRPDLLLATRVRAKPTTSVPSWSVPHFSICLLGWMPRPLSGVVTGRSGGTSFSFPPTFLY